MKYNKLYNIPAYLFVEHYEVVNDKIIIYHADGNKNEVDYSVEIEKNILKTISSQLSKGKEALIKKEDNPEIKLAKKILTSLIVFLISIFGSLAVITNKGFELIFLPLIFTTPFIIDEVYSQINYEKVKKEMEKSLYIVENLDYLKYYDERLTLINQKKDEKSLNLSKKINKYEEEHVVNALEIYSLKSMRAVIKSWEAQKLYVEDAATFKKNAPELVLENQKVKKLGQKK